jgi:hypothetical protein
MIRFPLGNYLKLKTDAGASGDEIQEQDWIPGE